MGGNKKKGAGAQDKGVASGPAGDVKQAKEEKKSKPQQRQKLSVILEELQGMKTISGMKAITVQGIAKNASIKISVANAFMKTLETRGIVKRVGGYSGHRVFEKVKQ